MKSKKTYNTGNLKPFTTDNASYYGSIGGVASGKSRLTKKIHTTRLQLAMMYLQIEPYKKRKKIYDKELDTIKSIIHNIKIYTNRLNKLLDRYNKKYSD